MRQGANNPNKNLGLLATQGSKTRCWCWWGLALALVLVLVFVLLSFRNALLKAFLSCATSSRSEPNRAEAQGIMGRLTGGLTGRLTGRQSTVWLLKN